MSPLLFSLSSKPLMCLLEDKKIKDELTGLKISDQNSLLYQLFVDDAGILTQHPTRIRKCQVHYPDL